MILVLLIAILFFPQAAFGGRTVRWEGKPVDVFISSKRLTRIEFSEPLKSILFSKPEISVEREDSSLYVRALADDAADTLFATAKSGAVYEIRLSTSEKPDDVVAISYAPASLKERVEQAQKSPTLELMRLMMLSLPAEGYEILEGGGKEVYRDGFFSMTIEKIYRSPILDGFVLEVRNIAAFPTVFKVDQIDFYGMVAVSADSDYLMPRPKKASEAVAGKDRTAMYLVALP